MNAITSRLTTIQNAFAGQQFPAANFWKGLFSWDYWSGANLSDTSPYALFFTVVVAVVIIALLYWRWRLKKLDAEMPIYRPVLIQLPTLITFIFVAAIVYVFGRSQELTLIASRFFILGTLIVIIAWLAFLVIYIYRVVPTKRRLHLEKERFLRYIPKKKERS